MKTQLYLFTFICSFFLFANNSSILAAGRYLVLNFDCHGEAAGKSEIIGDSLRYHLKKQGAKLVSRNLFDKIIAKKNLDESDLNYTIDKLSEVTRQLGASWAVYGHVLSSHDILTVELRSLSLDGAEPILMDPLVCGNLGDVFLMVPEMASLILSPDKTAPRVISVQPSEGKEDVGQFVDLVVKFSKPMNPSTFAVSALPEDMWKRFGDVKYDENNHTFTLKLHLFPDIKYEFHINGAESKAFKDQNGNVAPEYVWHFTTGRW